MDFLAPGGIMPDDWYYNLPLFKYLLPKELTVLSTKHGGGYDYFSGTSA